MKRILLSTAAMTLLFTTACTTTTEETNVNATDTVNMLPPADNTGPGIQGATPGMVDPNAVDMNSNPSGSTAPSGNSSSSNPGGSTSGSNSANTTNSNNTRGPQDVVVPAAPPKDAIKSTYKRAAPGDTVDGRTNMGSSR